VSNPPHGRQLAACNSFGDPAHQHTNGGGVVKHCHLPAEWERCERENLLVILERADWKVKGDDGAAELLGVKPTTLSARMKKMGIRPPD